jgi:hypothetical protein
MFEHFLSVAGQMHAVKDRRSDAILAQELRKSLLTLNLRDFSKVAVTPEKIKGVEHQTVLSARGKFGLQFPKICSAFVNDDHFPINDRLTGNIERAGND